VTSDKQFAKRK
jgi:hypothetical protein